MSYPPGVTDNDPYFDLPSVGEDEYGEEILDDIDTVLVDVSRWVLCVKCGHGFDPDDPDFGFCRVFDCSCYCRARAA